MKGHTLITPASLPASAIGLGCVTFGREIDEAAAREFLDHADACGISFFDTAAAYGQGESERILGRWLEARNADAGGLTVATKILPPYEAAMIKDGVEASLGRLRMPAVDLLYLHRWDATAESPEALGALDDLVRAGKVRALGVSNYSQPQLESALARQDKLGLSRFSVVQNNHNLAVREMGEGYRRFCAELGIAVVTYSPLGAGFLTGKHQGGVQQGSRFDVAPGHQDVYFHEEAWRRLKRLEEVAEQTGYSQAHLALAWALHQPGVASVLVGGRTRAHLDQALAALAFDEPEILGWLD